MCAIIDASVAFEVFGRKRTAVIPGVVGRIYTSRPDGHFTAEHGELLDADLCVGPKVQ